MVKISKLLYQFELPICDNKIKKVEKKEMDYFTFVPAEKEILALLVNSFLYFHFSHVNIDKIL